MDLVAWYTGPGWTAYVKGDKKAEDRLLTNRWRDVAREGAVDPDGDGNLYSFYYKSRLDLRGGKDDCEDLRAGCKSLGPDGEPGDYSLPGRGGAADELKPAGSAKARARAARARRARRHPR